MNLAAISSLWWRISVASSKLEWTSSLSVCFFFRFSSDVSIKSAPTDGRRSIILVGTSSSSIKSSEIGEAGFLSVSRSSKVIYEYKYYSIYHQSETLANTVSTALWNHLKINLLKDEKITLVKLKLSCLISKKRENLLKRITSWYDDLRRAIRSLIKCFFLNS